MEYFIVLNKQGKQKLKAAITGFHEKGGEKREMMSMLFPKVRVLPKGISHIQIEKISNHEKLTQQFVERTWGDLELGKCPKN